MPTCSARFFLRLFSTSPNPNPNRIPSPLRQLIKPIEKEKDPDALVSLFNLASSDPRFRLLNSIYSLSVRRLSAAGRPDAVESLIEHQKSHPDFIRSEHFAARLILLYGRANMLPHALSTFRSLKCPRTSFSLNALLTCYARAAGTDAKAIAALIEEVQSSHPEVSLSVVSYNIIVGFLCNRGEFEQAMDAIKLMEKKGISPNLVTYNTLLHGFYSKGRFGDGERIWERMGEEKDVRSYNARLRGLVSEGRVMDAAGVFDEMRKRGVKPDAYSYNALIKGYCQNGMLEAAKNVYLGLEKNGCDPDMATYRTLIPKAWEAKEFDFVVRLCNEGINIGCYLDVEMLQGVVDGLAEEEMFPKAKKLVKHVRSKEFYGSKCLRLPLPCLAA